MKSRIYFPLRSNANSLLRGAQEQAFRRSIKLAGLIHDEIYIEEGSWQASAGPGGSFQIWHPQSEPLMTPKERQASKRHPFHFALKPSDSGPDVPATVVIQSETEIHWRVTFEHLKNELPKESHKWILFGHADSPNDAESKAILDSWIENDNSDSNINDRFDSSFVRKLVIESANKDLLLASHLKAAVQMDSLHNSIIRARLSRGEAQPVFGPRALSILFPELVNLGWEEIQDLRKSKGLKELRELLAEIEQIALEEVENENGWNKQIEKEYRARTASAIDTMSVSFVERCLLAGFSLVVGQVAGFATGVPPMGSLVGGAAGIGANIAVAKMKRPKWLLADSRFRRKSPTITKH